MVGRVVERIPVGGIDAVDKQIGVEFGMADECQHSAGFRVERDECTAVAAECLFGDGLQFAVEVQHQIIAGYRIGMREHAHCVAACIGFHLLCAGSAMELRLIALLDTDFADVVGAAIIVVAPVILQFLQVGIVNAADIADQVRGGRAQRVLAE
jgi:hypothetical protein